MFDYLKKLLPSSPFVLFQSIVEVPAFHPITKGISEGPPLLARAFDGQGSFSDFLVALFNIAISVGAILAVLRIAYAGFKYMTTDAMGQKSDSKEMIQNAVTGLLLLLAIVLILERINPDLLKMNFELGVNESSTTQQGGGLGFPFSGN